MKAPARFARNIASHRHITVGRAASFAKWFLRHRGPAPAAATSRYQFVYHLARHLRESSTLRIMSPLNGSQLTYARVSRTVERWMQVAAGAARRVSSAPASIVYGLASLWRSEAIRPDSARPSRVSTPGVIHRSLPPLPMRTTMPVAPRWLALASDWRGPLQPQRVQQYPGERRGIAQSTTVIRSQTVPLILPSEMGLAHQPPTSTRGETRPQERVFVASSAPAPASPGSFAPGWAARGAVVHTAPPSVASSTQSFFSSWVTAPLTLVSNRYLAGAAASSAVMQDEARMIKGTAPPFAMATTVPSAAGETPFTTIAAAQNSAQSLSFALRLRGARTIRELQPSTGMILSVRPEQVVATTNTSYVFAQQPRPIAADPSSGLAADRRELVDLVQKEVRHAMASGAVVDHFTRNDYASITDQVERLLRRRLVVEKERMGFPS